MSEEDILKLIRDIDSEMKEFRMKMTQYRQQMLDAETELIGTKLKKDRLLEELRILRLRKVPTNLNETELEIQKFREKFPELVDWANHGRKSD